MRALFVAAVAPLGRVSPSGGLVRFRQQQPFTSEEIEGVLHEERGCAPGSLEPYSSENVLTSVQDELSKRVSHERTDICRGRGQGQIGSMISFFYLFS